jgi:hypothetical protein
MPIQFKGEHIRQIQHFKLKKGPTVVLQKGTAQIIIVKLNHSDSCKYRYVPVTGMSEALENVLVKSESLKFRGIFFVGIQKNRVTLSKWT